LRSSNQVNEGTALESPADNGAELTAQGQNFVDKHQPILKAPGIA